MTNRTLGILALIGAPFLLISFKMPNLHVDAIGDSSLSNALGLIYLLGWMCSIIALRRMGATGNSIFGKALLPTLLVTLTVASISNVYAVLNPDNQSPLYFYLDLCWPISNFLMFVTGVTVAVANKLKGWQRFVPLMAGTWFPLLLACMATEGRTPVTGTILGIYSSAAWSLMAIMIIITKNREKEVKRQEVIYPHELLLPKQPK